MTCSNDPPVLPRRSLPSIFDGLPPGPIDLALLHDLMERDFERRALATLDRVLALRHPASDGPTPPAADRAEPG